MPKHDKFDLLAVALLAFILGYLARGGPNPCPPKPDCMAEIDQAWATGYAWGRAARK